MANLVAMTTVNLTFVERENYVPPQAQSFGTSISRTFAGSVEALQSFGRGVVLFAVAVGPWLPVIVVVVAPVWWTIRRRRRDDLIDETTTTPAAGHSSG